MGQKTKVKGEIIGSRIVVVIATICVSSSCSVAVKLYYIFSIVEWKSKSWTDITTTHCMDFRMQSWGVMNLTIKQH